MQDIYTETTVEIHRRVCLEPQYLDSNVLTHLLDTVKRSTVRECTAEYGYILDVTRIVRVLNNRIASANSDIVFSLVFEAKTFHPSVNDNVQGTVCKVVPQGFMVKVHGKNIIFVPLMLLPRDSTYHDTPHSHIVNGETCVNYEADKDITVSITSARYVDHKYQYLAKLA